MLPSSNLPFLYTIKMARRVISNSQLFKLKPYKGCQSDTILGYQGAGMHAIDHVEVTHTTVIC